MVKLSKKARLFSRDLPDDYDPHYFYEYRIAKRSKEAEGVEGFVYKLIPWSLIRSFAFAIDPLSNFKTASGRISPAHRTRTGTTLSVLDRRREQNHVTGVEWAAAKNFNNSPGSYGPISYRVVLDDDYGNNRGSQSPLPRILKDTTYRTRPLGYTMGEFEKTIPKIYSPGRSLFWSETGTQTYDIGVGQVYPDYRKSLKTWYYSISPSSASYSTTDYNNVANSERTIILQHMQKNALSMYKGINPSFRNYSLFRNVVELRDLPRSIQTLKTTLDNFRILERLLDPRILKELRLGRKPSSLPKDLAGEYLSYNFGWKQLYKDVMDLVRKPELISKQIDFIIRNSGKALTLRSKRQFVSSGSAPGFTYDTMGGNLIEQSTRLTREIELRLVVNMFINFPTINNPKFREDLFSYKLGSYPSFTDLYNLVPWTWLTDWFTGLGNYLEIIEEINHDKNLINWGLITGTSSVDITTTYVDETYDRSWTYHNNSLTGQTDSRRKNTHSSVLHMDLQVRKNLASILDVNTTSDSSTLSTYQNTILGALVLQRVNFRK